MKKKMNYDAVEMRQAEPEMTETKQRNYLVKVVKDAERTRRQAVAMKSNATKSFKAGKNHWRRKGLSS